MLILPWCHRSMASRVSGVSGVSLTPPPLVSESE